MAKIGLQGSRIEALIRQRVAEGMPQHVGMNLKANLGLVAGPRGRYTIRQRARVPSGGRHEEAAMTLWPRTLFFASALIGAAVLFLLIDYLAHGYPG
jgi:hypothetical protein